MIKYTIHLVLTISNDNYWFLVLFSLDRKLARVSEGSQVVQAKVEIEQRAQFSLTPSQGHKCVK